MSDTTFSQYQQEIMECYSLDTNAIIFPFNKSVCMNLVSANNNDCKKFPQSVMLSMYMDVFDTVSPPYQPVEFVYDFNYSISDFVCIPCLDPICQTKEFYLSSKIMLKVESTSRFTTVVCGQVTVQEENRSNCFYPNRPDKEIQSQVIFKRFETCYYAAFNGQCPNISPFILVNATVHISYNSGNVQSYLYLPTDTVNTYINNVTHLTFCFSDPNNLRESSKSYPLNATIDIQIEQSSTAVQLKGYTFLIGTELTTNGYSSTIAFFQLVEIQLFGIINQTEKLQITNLLSQYQNGNFFSSMSIFSPSSNLVVNAFSIVIFKVQEDAVKYMGYYSNPEIPSQIKQILTTEKLQDLIIYWDQFVSDTQNNVVFHSRKKIDNIWLTCWKNITVTWTSLQDIRVDIQNRAEQHNCQIYGNISVRAILAIMNDTVNNDVFPAFELDVNNYNINMTSFNMHSSIPNIKNIVSECYYVQFQLLYKSTGSYIENIEVNNWQLEINQNKTQQIVLFSCISITLVIELIRLKLQYKDMKKHQKEEENESIQEDSQIIVEDLK
ncbi:Conserved_hypothetical protein [Hexamita inflata]|uniref:Uncharacterized protein n=1 Tax=Hexamita inflata TaxID=28002 RepID=A0AA86NES3_9EUKA|nr:Conserved hypothetical protein [Hexamita inflata]